jgi:galactokinase
MTAGLADQLDLAPELRMACYAFGEEFGRPPTVVWRVPGTVTLLASSASGTSASGTGARLTVEAPWGVIAVAAPRDDGILELAVMERPGETTRTTAARTGAALLISSELPDGTGVGAGLATKTAIRRCLDACASGLSGVTDARDPEGLGVTSDAPGAETARLPLDLARAGFRLVVIDTRVRGDAVPPGDERSPLDVAAAAFAAGDLETFGGLLTAAHRATYRGWPGGEEQDLAVTAALRAGAAGARAIIDGPGRPALALVPVGRLPGLRAEISSAFAARGLRAPRLLTFTPASPLTFTPQ